MKFWGITGTNGKTTTTWVFAEFVNACEGRKCGYITTVEAFDGRDRYPTGYTTPPLAQLKEIYAKMEANGCTDCVMEVSSHAIHQHRTGDTPFSGGAVTNVSQDHLDYHKTMEEYFTVKLDFARWMPKGAPYVVCTDGENGMRMLEAVEDIGGLDVHAVTRTDPRHDLAGLPLIGDFNESNVLTAAELANAAGVPAGVIHLVIPKLEARWGRLEPVDNDHVAASVYVDFAHTPDGLEKVLSAVRSFYSLGPQQKLWVVFGAGGDRDRTKRPLMGAACAKLADRLVITSDNPRSEEPGAIIRDILGGIDYDHCAPYVEPDRKKAIEYALANAGAEDVVVIAGKGHETTQEIAGVKHPFDDREVVRNFAG